MASRLSSRNPIFFALLSSQNIPLDRDAKPLRREAFINSQILISILQEKSGALFSSQFIQQTFLSFDRFSWKTHAKRNKR